MAIVHELSWSTSRSRTFATCRRRYYFDYYLSWLGWGQRADPDRRRAYLLKKMTRMPMLAGDIVHRAIAEFFARRDQGLAWSAEEAIAWSVGELRRGYKESRDGGWKARPAKSVRLAEHHYEEERIDESTGAAGDYGKRYVERIEACLRSFFDDPALEGARSAEPADWLACEDMSTFVLFDTKVFAVPDFAYWDRGADADGGVCRIVDWKTGAPRDADRFQLQVYAFYAREQWGVDPARTVAEDVYLRDGEIAEVRVDQDELEATLEAIEASIGEMRAVHFDADRSKGDAAAFPLVAEERAGAVCSSCNYRELCHRA
ncbi:MAG: PD-(D/E)XK nuclease family protein [Planctomycetota bacterium]